jgi:class 3 adenylate cyclase
MTLRVIPQGTPVLASSVGRGATGMSIEARAERETGPAAAGLSDIVLPPDTHYARSGDVHIAYQVVGERPIDLVYVPSWGSQVEQLWEEPSLVRLLRRLLSFCRLILFDRRGSGLSDPVVGAPTLEERMDDVRAVLDEVGSRRAALLGFSDGGPMSALFAATYPERTSALVLYGTTPRELWAPDFPWGRTLAQRRQLVELMLGDWGHGSGIELVAPSAAEDETFRRWFARMQRLSASPGTALEIMRTIEQIDVRRVLPTIRVPTLVLHRAGDRLVPVEAGRRVAELIPDATYVELPGDDHLPMLGDSDGVVDEIEEFLTGTHHERESDRVLATILFTDIVGSTRRASQLGDRRWRDLLEGHHRIVRRELARFRGREVKTVGDGFMATFDGPARAIRCASAIVGSVRALGIEVRAGLHTGECEVMGEDIGGLAVHIAARVAAAAGPGEVLASRTVTDLVAGSRIEFTERGGARALKGVPGRWQLFAVNPR